MAAKPESTNTAAATPPPAAAAPAPKGGAIAQLIPLIAAIVLAPVLSWVVAEFVLLPRMQKKIATLKAGDAAEEAAPTEPKAAEGGHGAAPKGGHGAKGGKEGAGPANYEFKNVVVNLAGTMGTRYLKTSFIITGSDAKIKSIFEGELPKLTDVTLNVLSSLTLADLEEPGAKNVLRERLVLAYNEALGRRVADQVYFSDFVVQ